MVSNFTILNSLSQTSLSVDSRSWGLNYTKSEPYLL